ncbi:MAG: glycosyltransferase [Pseudomonadota bacterium]
MDTTLVSSHIAIERFQATVAGRFAAERRLRSLAAFGDSVLCMGNLPPLFPCSGRVTVFLQNRYLCSDASLAGMSFKVRLRLVVERIWLRLRFRPEMRLFVQTTSMQLAAEHYLGFNVSVVPFTAVMPTFPAPGKCSDTPRFLYPASADKHKNHVNLLRAWQLLVEDGVDAELHLTVNMNADLADTVENLRRAGIRVINHGELDSASLAKLYSSCNALVYPSGMESFGLPLLEARAAGLPIIAAERDYVRDVVEPKETFDPDSPVSIARAVRRFLGIPDRIIVPLSPAEFMCQVFN